MTDKNSFSMENITPVATTVIITRGEMNSVAVKIMMEGEITDINNDSH